MSAGDATASVNDDDVEVDRRHGALSTDSNDEHEDCKQRNNSQHILYFYKRTHFDFEPYESLATIIDCHHVYANSITVVAIRNK